GGPRPGPWPAPRPSASCRVVSVDAHVLLRKVTTPRLRLALTKAERGHDLDLRLLEGPPDGPQVDVAPGTALEHHEPTHRQVEAIERQLGATVAERADYPAPVGVAAVDRRLDQARRRDRARGRPCVRVGLRVGDPDGDQLGRAF